MADEQCDERIMPMQRLENGASANQQLDTGCQLNVSYFIGSRLSQMMDRYQADKEPDHIEVRPAH